ncbi:MAG: DinB family protein [Parabacteroides sp.]
MQKQDFTAITTGIARVIETEEGVLNSLSVEAITLRRNSQNRTIKQILGHLIDSASNNHQRMVRLQYSKDLLFFFPDYRQDNDLWIALQDYQHTDWSNLIQLWKFYNLHIIQVIQSVDKSKLDSYWCDFEGTKVTLKDMIEGYLDHLLLHVGEIHELMVEHTNL